jgi:hypothetical protein
MCGCRALLPSRTCAWTPATTGESGVEGSVAERRCRWGGADCCFGRRSSRRYWGLGSGMGFAGVGFVGQWGRPGGQSWGSTTPAYFRSKVWFGDLDGGGETGRGSVRRLVVVGAGLASTADVRWGVPYFAPIGRLVTSISVLLGQVAEVSVSPYIALLLCLSVRWRAGRLSLWILDVKWN